MATSVAGTLRVFISGLSHGATIKRPRHACRLIRKCSRLMCTQSTTQSTHSDKQDPSPFFLNGEVQGILKKLTGFDIDKIFRVRPTSEFGGPKYELMTDQQLKEVQYDYMKKGQERLQMPPVMKEWDDSVEVISEDPEIEGFHTDSFVFTDITYGIKRRSRLVVIREPNGVLRTASAAERDQVMQLYFPHDGRMYQTPQLFDTQNLEVILSEGRYEYILDRACVQYEPDNPEYIRIVQRTYEHLDTTSRYDDLRSTRHFGGMAFYYASYRKIDGLLRDMIQRDRLEDAGDLVQLYHILNPKSKSAEHCQSKPKVTAMERIQAYVSQDSHNPGPLELALQTYTERAA